MSHTQGTQHTSQDLQQRYTALLARKKNLEAENSQLRQDIEYFNTALNDREKDIERLQYRLTSLLTLLRQMQQEEQRLPTTHVHVSERKRLFEEYLTQADPTQTVSPGDLKEQEILALNVWLVTRDRFIEQIIGFYTRKRDRVVVIPDYELVKELMDAGLFPDIIITGSYDFGLDDPHHEAFFDFLEQVFEQNNALSEREDFLLLTLSSNVQEPLGTTRQIHAHHARSEYISKFRGLQITISEVRFFLEHQRCQSKGMEAEISAHIDSMGAVARTMLSIQKQRKTGILAVLSTDNSPEVRWAYLLFYFHGKLVKTEHTLESSVVIPREGKDEPLKKIFTLSSIDSQFPLNQPEQLFFFPLYQHVILHEMQDQTDTPLLQEESFVSDI